MKQLNFLFLGLGLVLAACNSNPEGKASSESEKNKTKKASADSEMVFIPGGTYMMGGDNDQASPDELPKHKVTVNDFWMDVTEVTNEQFAEFVEATGYITTAEQNPTGKN